VIHKSQGISLSSKQLSASQVRLCFTEVVTAELSSLKLIEENRLCTLLSTITLSAWVNAYNFMQLDELNSICGRL